MKICDIQEAKAQLSNLIERAEAGEDIVIARAGKPAARLVPYKEFDGRRKGGQWHGQVHISAEFDELPDEIAIAFGMNPP